jgi:protein N-lysine methyltransferase METTL21D
LLLDIPANMYFYISFLRPPPTAASPSARTIAITPQVANDLRTELFPGAVDLYYVWAPTSPALRATRPAKLTTWTAASAYKELAVGLPPGVRDGQAWTLVLSTALVGPRIALSDAGSTPFAVLSMPIDFTARASAAPAKQERIRRVLSLGADVDIAITEQTSFDLDKVGPRPRTYAMRPTYAAVDRNCGTVGLA